MMIPVTADDRRGQALNRMFIALAFALSFWQLFGLPWWGLPHSPWWGLTLLPITLLNNSFWALLHEAIHGLLRPERRLNDQYGRALAVCFGAPLRVLRTGHLLHHRFSRTRRERTEVYDSAPGPTAGFVITYYLRLCGGLYLAEVAAGLLVWLPERALMGIERRVDSDDSVAGLVLRNLRNPAHRREVRLDAALIVLMLGASVWLYGEQVWMLVAALLARAFLVSFADNAYHYDTPLDRPRDAANLALPRPLAALLLFFNLHGVHHRYPNQPWYRLHAGFERDGDRYAAPLFSRALAQFRGPLPLSRFQEP